MDGGTGDGPRVLPSGRMKGYPGVLRGTKIVPAEYAHTIKEGLEKDCGIYRQSTTKHPLHRSGASIDSNKVKRSELS